MINYKSNFPIPAINVETLEFENINYLEFIDSDKFKFYSDDSLKGLNLDNNIFKNSDLELNELNNYCPKCKTFSLDFYERFLTD